MPPIRAITIAGSLLVVGATSSCKDSVDPPARSITVTAVSPTSGAQGGGTSVTITGTNFTDVSSVTIGGGELIGRTMLGPTQITGTTAAATGAGLKDVVVTSTSHGSGTCAGCFNYLPPVALSALAAGESHTCAIASSGASYCWGLNSDGQVGNGSTISSATPVAVSGGLSFRGIGAGAFHNCGLTSANAAYCWGSNGDGELGNASFQSSAVPVAVVGGLSFSAIATGGVYHTCGLTSAGAAYCWGRNRSGQLGNGVTGGESSTPVAVSGGQSFTALGLGDFFTCGLTHSGAAYCWGDNTNGQLGTGSTTNSSVPVAVSGGLVFSAIAVGSSSACGLTSMGAAHCWGSNFFGQLGNGSTMESTTPVAVAGGNTFSGVVARGGHTCGLTSDGSAYCWGVNSSGQLGDGSTGHKSTPVPVSGALRFVLLAAGSGHTCGLTSVGATYCWGRNEYGQLGNGLTTNSSIPVAVGPPQ